MDIQRRSINDATLQMNGQLNLKVKIIGTPNALPVVSFLNYSYNDNFSMFTGKFPITVDDAIDLTGIWSLDVQLGTGICDEVLIMDETNAILLLEFNTDNTITFLNDPSDEGLNGAGFSQTYTLVDDTITLNFSDSGSTLQATMQYNYDIGSDFTGSYVNTWDDGVQCSNSIHMYKL